MENSKSYLLNFVVSLVQRFCNQSNATISYCFRKNSYTHLVCVDCEETRLKDEFYAERIKFSFEFAEKFITNYKGSIRQLYPVHLMLFNEYIRNGKQYEIAINL